MDQFERFLDYEKQVAEFKLKTISRFQKGLKGKPEKRTSKVNVVEHVLKIAGRPLHVSEIIQIANRDFNVHLERDSIVSRPKIYQNSPQYLCLERITIH
jgi:hypothetical protein